MKNYILYICLITPFFLASTHAQTRLVEGTWINLPYQDVRNKYMNPAHVDCTNPLFWEQKIKEYSEMGMSYLVIMAIANDQKSYYPSRFMNPAYPSDRESPVEAIMRSADKYNMNVFLSSGWAIDQDDDLRNPEIRNIQLQIMKEAAQLFANHKSFFGWYLPVEDSMEPILSDHAVDAVNTLAQEARSLTPEAQIMISPYGLCNADIQNKKFGDQIKKLKVDIIAYQDEVGCVREPMPMKRMKEHFKILGDIHKETNIRFWANVESFTWEKETNSRESALIPAAFPRYLSQIAGVSQAGVEKILSFSIYGLYDNPHSEMPIGQPYYAAKAYKDYMDWKQKRGRWQVLEEIFKNNLSHDAVGKKITYFTYPDKKYNKGNLLDRKFGQENYELDSWLGFKDGVMEVMIDLGSKEKIKNLVARFLHYKKASIHLPSMVDFYVSDNGKDFIKAKTIAMESSGNDLHDCWIDIALAEELDVKGRYVKIVATGKDQFWIFCDEILVNAKTDKNR